MPGHESSGVVAPDLQADDDEGTPGGGWGAQFSAQLDLAIGKLGDRITSTLDDNLRKMRAEARALPALVKISTAFTYSSTGPVIVGQGGTGQGVLIGGAEIGRQWTIRQCIVGGTTLTASPAGVAWLLVSAAPPNELSITSVIDQATSLPLIAFYSEEQFYLAPNENLYLVVTGGTNGVTYVSSISYQESAFIPRQTVESI